MYLGWGISIQKANRLYNKYSSDEIKSHLINISENYSLIKTCLITNYGGPQKSWGILLASYPGSLNPCWVIERRSLVLCSYNWFYTEIGEII